MKKITLLFCVLAGFAMNAQIHSVEWTTLGANPREGNDEQEQPWGFLDVTYSGWSLVIDNTASTWSTAQTLPFPFKFNGTTETSFSVHPEGFVTFSASPSAISTMPTSLPSANIPDKTVCVNGINISGANDAVAQKTFGQAPYRQQWIMWASASSSSSTVSWTYWAVVFEESTNNIYIVDQRTYGGNVSLIAGVQISSTSATQAPGSPNLASVTLATSGNGSDATDNKVFAFVHNPSSMPTVDAAGQKINLPPYVSINQAQDIKGELVNYGSTAITEVEVYFQVDGGSPTMHTVTGLNVAPGERKPFVVAGGYTPTVVGSKDLKVWFGDVNKTSQVDNINDTIYQTISAVGSVLPRFPLYESFTSSTCVPCVAGNANVEALFAANPAGGQSSIKYQMSWPGTGDPYYTDEGYSRRLYYNVTSVPNMQIDGGWNGNSASVTQAIMDQFKAEPAFVEIVALYHISGQTITVDVMLNPVGDVGAGDLKLHVAVKENVTYKNVKSNGETEFHDVMKKMLPDGNGTIISDLTNGNNVKYSYSYTFNGSYRLPSNATDPINNATENSVEDFNNLSVVVWLQDDSSAEIFQSAEGQYVLGIDDFDPINHNVLVYPNPAKDYTSVSIDMSKRGTANISVVNMLGQTVLNVSETVESGTNKVNLSTAGLTAGVYFVQVDVDGKVQTVKLTVQ